HHSLKGLRRPGFWRCSIRPPWHCWSPLEKPKQRSSSCWRSWSEKKDVSQSTPTKDNDRIQCFELLSARITANSTISKTAFHSPTRHRPDVLQVGALRSFLSANWWRSAEFDGTWRAIQNRWIDTGECS